MREVKVIQNAGAVLVMKRELCSFPTSCLTNANRAISIAKAMRVMVAARKDVRDERRVAVVWVEKERRRAMHEMLAAGRDERVLELDQARACISFRRRTDWMNGQAASPTGPNSDRVVRTAVPNNNAVSVSARAAIAVSRGRLDGAISPHSKLVVRHPSGTSKTRQGPDYLLSTD